MKTTDLIKSLVAEIKPVKIMASPWKRLGQWLIITLLCLGIILSFIGVRHDLFQAFHSFEYLIETFFIFIFTLLAAFSAFILSIPDEENIYQIRWLILVPLIGWSLFLVFKTVHFGIHMDPSVTRGYLCFRDLALISVIPGIVLFIMLSQASPLKLKWTGSLAGLAAAGIGAFALQMVCTAVNPLHIFMWHILPILIIGIIGFYLGSKLFKK